ncbi:Na+/H+ antiporter NhaA [Actinotalea ferrariae]|uniref:Na+/H+ antiporter NhaA n=1 Tax=Actinotalea ferrariae TaxID=1386098 RepID=UPI001C8B109B|nr:Na+/H+ antiporter NhaA [Actinotalea ferrariae]MBX9245002.1 Na+/H+ antiporter NhaA [Actinotalea ferrariae]
MAQPRPELFDHVSPGSERNLADTLRGERAGAVLLLVGTVVALVWANSPWRDAYAEIAGTVVGPASLHLDLSIAAWATDGLLAIFFFVVGLELKREIVDGELRRPSTAIVPILAAVGGMAVPAAFYVLVVTLRDGPLHGWAIPVATDIAFAVAVLGIAGRRLPTALRAFLLTLAVVDDLLGIVVIAIFYAQGLALGWLLAALATVAAFGVVVRRTTSPWLLLPLGVAAWTFMHASGVHATIAGVLLGFTAPALARRGEEESVAERLEHRWRPISAGVAVPIFALFAAGVMLSPEALAGTVADPAAQGVALGLVVGKPLGIVLATFLLVKLTRATLDPSVRWADVVAVGVVAGIGFTVSLLIGELSFEDGSPHTEHVKAAILIASVTAAVLGALLLRWRTRRHARHLAERRRGVAADGQG